MDSSRIAAITFFAGLPDADLAAIASLAFDVEIARGQALATEGGLGHAVFAVEAGTADVVIGGTTLSTIGPGDVVGEMAVLASPPDPFAPAEEAKGGQRTASVVATSPMRLVGLYKRDVHELDRRAPMAASRLRAAFEKHRALDEERTGNQQ